MSSITDDQIDALFTPRQQPLFAEGRRITCRVCERASVQVADGVLLCQSCAALGASGLRSHIATVTDGATAALERAWGKLEQELAAADPPLLDRWNAFQDAVTHRKPEAFAAEDKARGGMVGGLADLIRLWCFYRDAQSAYEARCRWADLAELTIVLWADEVME